LTERPDQSPEYNPSTNTFEGGSEQTEEAETPAPVADADTSTRKENGEKVADDQNRTEADSVEQEQRHEAEVAEIATNVEQKKGQEEAAATEEKHETQTPEQNAADAEAAMDAILNGN
jgi:hypothetical protein